MQKVVEIESLFNRIKMLQKTFSLIREGRIKASDFPSRTDELVQAIKVDIEQAIKNMKRDCRDNVKWLEDYSNQLQECCTQTEYYIPTGIRAEVPTPPTVTDALIDACNLQSEEAAHELFVKYIFIIDERNEIARRLESELARLKQDAEAARLEREQEKERERLEKEQERKERQKEQAELVKSIAEMVNKQKEEQKPKKAQKKASFMELVGTDDKEKKVIKRLHNLIDRKGGIYIDETKKTGRLKSKC